MAIAEQESSALRAFIQNYPVRVSSILAHTEVLRAVRPQGFAAGQHAKAVLETITRVGLTDEIAESAGLLQPQALRSLDAIHLATALALRPTLAAVVTYDRRLAAGAELQGLPVVMPGIK
jgi:uncharacterized protein